MISLALLNKQHNISCPECGAGMILLKSNKYVYGDGNQRLFYGCSRFPDCRGSHAAQPNGSPVGHPANAETRKWRQAAHGIFDKMWKQWGYTREQAYIFLQRVMNLSGEEAHIGKFSTIQCQSLVDLINSNPEWQNPDFLPLDLKEELPND